jgi:hypothetical protein
MPFYIVQGGSTLKKMTTAGALTSLLLPDTVTVNAAKRLRGAALGNTVVLVNSPSENVSVDIFDTVRPLALRPPGTKVTVGTAAGGSLSGSYRVKETYVMRDPNGAVIAESDFGPISDAVAPSSQYITVVPTISLQDVRGSISRKLYRTTTGGSTYFPWTEADGNAALTIRDDLSDAGLELVAAPTDLGTPPKFSNIMEWKERLWGVPENDFDTLWQSAPGKGYAWPVSRTFVIPPKRDDAIGITGFIRRRDELGVGRRKALFKIVGTSHTNFSRQTVTDQIGLWATDSAVTIHDIGYFLGNPFGVYTWGPGGVENITDEKVKAWFATDTYFNRSEFDQAVGWYDPLQHAYVLLLASAGQTTLDRWIQYNISTKTWWGPHKTGEFTPTGGVQIDNANGVKVPCIYASNGLLYTPTTTKTDGASTAVDYDLLSNWLSGGTPDIHKTWLDPSVVSKIQASGTLTLTPRVGKIGAAEGSARSHDMTLGSQRLPILGDGEFLQLRLRQNTNAVDVVLYGVDVPFFENGRRS